jgi:hypothetical protein
VLGLGGGAVGVRALRAEAQEVARIEAKATADAGVKAIEQRVVFLEQVAVQQGRATFETQVDIRELYRVVRDGRKSDRLERAPAAPSGTDGGR